MKTALDQELLLEFFLTFSRFEYALKATGYLKSDSSVPPKWPRAAPDWSRFADYLQDDFNPSVTDDLRQACEYMLNSPPMQQVIRKGAVAWETLVRPENETDIQFLLQMVRCLRNNLFHGGTYNFQVHQETKHTELLLRSSLTLLAACLEIGPEQQAAYRDAWL